MRPIKYFHIGKFWVYWIFDSDVYNGWSISTNIQTWKHNNKTEKMTYINLGYFRIWISREINSTKGL